VSKSETPKQEIRAEDEKTNPYTVVMTQLQVKIKEVLDQQPAIRSVALIIDWAIPQMSNRQNPPAGAWIVQPQTMSPLDVLAVSGKISDFQAGFCQRGVMMFQQQQQPVRKVTDGEEQANTGMGELNTLQPGGNPQDLSGGTQGDPRG